MLVHGNHAESLRDLLVGWMKRYPLAPLENEVILVQSNGIAQWLKLALAADASDEGAGVGGGCGIAGALSFSLPARFLWQVYRALLGREAVPEVSAFDKPRLLWRLLRLLPAVLNEPVYAPLHSFLESDGDLRKRFQLAERLADLYDQYQVYRADWLAAWASGDDVLIDARGVCSPLAADQQWQAALWRVLLADVAAADLVQGVAAGQGRAAVHAAFLQRVASWRDAERPPALPRRVMVFGISSLPRQSLEVLAALGRWTQVLLCVQNPCEHFWADIVAGKDLLRAQAVRQKRRQGVPPALSDEQLHLHANPLLAAWGKQGRDFIALLDEHDSDTARGDYARHFAAIGQRIDLFTSAGTDSVLAQLQDDIRDLRPLAETRARWPAIDPASDQSIRFHVAHGAQREVEILHDQLLAAFAADRSLRPRDVIVMVPEIDAYTPHIQAVFGLLGSDDARHIPFSVADQGRRRSDPLIHAIELLLALPQSRLSVSDLLDLLEVPALRQRFAIAEAELPLLHRWIRGANIRWGLHAEQRASLGLPLEAAQAAQNSWLFGLRRMLLGYAVGDGAAAWQGIEPYGEIGGLDAAALGPLVLLLERIDATWRSLREPAPVRGWCDRLRQLLADFFVAESGRGSDSDSDRDAYTLLQLAGALRRWQEAADEAALAESLPLTVVADFWLSSLDEGGLAQRFFGGAVTFATLMPMRAIPFRQVCLLGMNDGDFPRTRIPMDFDLMSRDYRPGDRSRREDDRYLFLEALLSARERLYISWVGRSINDNTTRPPSVLVAQLRDHLAAGWRVADAAGAANEFGGPAGAALLAALTVEHRLQAFSRDYFPAQPATSPLFTYAREWRGGQAAKSVVDNDAPLPPIDHPEPLSLRELVDFVKDPVRAFFRQRLGVRFEADDPASEDLEPFVLDGLGKWALQSELMNAQALALSEQHRGAAARADCLSGIQRRGELANGGFGAVMAEELVAPMDELFERYAAALARWPQSDGEEDEIRFAATLDGERLELADWLGGLRRNSAGARGRVVLESSDLVKDKQYRIEKLIGHWLAHLAGQLAGEPLSTEVISKVGDVTFHPLAAAAAVTHLTTILAAWQQGMRRPLPLAAKTAFAWLKALPDTSAASGANEERLLEKAGKAARAAYEGGDRQGGELAYSAYLQRAWPSFDALVASGEFVELAETLLRPLQQAIFAKKGASA
ncbi:exodeoxyribonuclease V subunit gamma [Candidatus Accumulibacter sp. ACC003]|uniref:exodeoxyribonuclease V subunit gamma n=1 Tax=Candidatus Accumulibacter sp. ACC003 TaxID=2823334 RepID=UPI0025BC0203|nr:exodeoxyribonuclease V subunit gamma [Candidatus Accumulibacter sp. ACC003]